MGKRKVATGRSSQRSGVATDSANNEEHQNRPHWTTILIAVVSILLTVAVPLCGVLFYYTISQPISRIETGQGEIKDSHKELDAKVDKIDKEVTSIQFIRSTVENTQEQVRELQKTVNEVDGLPDKMKEIQKTLNEILPRVEQASTTASAASKAADSASTGIMQAKTDLAQTATQLKGLKEIPDNLATITKAVGEVKREVADLLVKIDANSKNIDALVRNQGSKAEKTSATVAVSLANPTGEGVEGKGGVLYFTYEFGPSLDALFSRGETSIKVQSTTFASRTGWTPRNVIVTSEVEKYDLKVVVIVPSKYEGDFRSHAKEADLVAYVVVAAN